MSHTEIGLVARESKTAQKATSKIKFVKSTKLAAGMIVECYTHDEEGDRKVNLPIDSVKPTSHVDSYCGAGELLELFIKGWDCDPIYISKKVWIETVKPAKKAKKLSKVRINKAADIPAAEAELGIFKYEKVGINCFEYEVGTEWERNYNKDLIVRILGLINITDITIID